MLFIRTIYLTKCNQKAPINQYSKAPRCGGGKSGFLKSISNKSGYNINQSVKKDHLQ